MGVRKPPLAPEDSASSGVPPSFPERLRQFLFGRPRSLADTAIFHRLTLVPFLA